MRRTAIVTSLVLLVVVVGIATPASAHSPLFPQGNNSLETAMVIDDPAKSWAIYHQLESDQADYYQMVFSAGDRIYLQTLTPSAPGFLPDLALLMPGPGPSDDLPSFVQVPTGYHAIVVPGDPAAEGELEPFTPGPAFMLATIDINATQDGTYYAVVFSGEQGGSYAIAIGYIEGFTAGEILSLPVDLVTIYQWEGQPLWLAILPYVLVFVVGFILAFYWYKKTERPNTWVKGLALIASLAFFGSTANIIMQLAFAFTMVPISSQVWLSLGFAAAYLIMGVLLMRFAYKRSEITLAWRVGFILIGIIGLTMWGGFYVGPLLSLVVGLAPPYKRPK